MQGQDALKLRYACDLAQLPSVLAERFVQLEADDGLRSFLAEVRGRPHGALVTALYDLLRRVMSDYDAYGLLGMYPMQLLSTAELERLLGVGPRTSLLDVGAGSGGVTAHAAALFASTTVTESSPVLRRKLRARGYRVLEHDLSLAPLASDEHFDAITCLNVLDRCLRPHSLLTHLRELLGPDGRLVLSVPLPLKPHVHVGRFTVSPEESLPPAGSSFELGVSSLLAKAIAPAGLEIARLARAPYVCRGDAHRPLYALDAAVLVCVRANAHTASTAKL
jgi:SAM-dependent methyltransferase